MTQNPLKKKLASGKPVVGAWSLMPSPMVAENLAWAGMEFVIIDMEHGTFDPAAVDECVRACEAAGASPLVRIPGLNAAAAQWALDSGAHGIVVPQISGAAEAKSAVALAKFPPEGTRGYNPFVRASRYSGQRDVAGSTLHNDFTLACVIVENKLSLDALESICALPGLDVVYIGVYDLSAALGCDVSDPQIAAIVSRSVATITKAGKVAGMMVRSPKEMKQAIGMGAKFIVVGVDTFLLREAAVNSVRAFAEAAA